MKIINDNKIDMRKLKSVFEKPSLFEKSADKFWNDEHISDQMLRLHLNPEVESASKAKDTIVAETNFIINWTGMNSEHAVLDLGCGPGLYVEKFAKTGARVSGVDLSQRSIDYANAKIRPKQINTDFIRMNYLDMQFREAFDIVTLIFYDFCVLDTEEQKMLLEKIHRALKTDGVFIFDVVSENRKCFPSTSISVCEGGFWSPKPYLEVLQTYMYEEPKTEGMHYTIIDDDGAARVIKLYHRLFSLAELTDMLNECCFRVEGVYKNLKGETVSEESETFGIVARKVDRQHFVGQLL